MRRGDRSEERNIGGREDGKRRDNEKRKDDWEGIG